MNQGVFRFWIGDLGGRRWLRRPTGSLRRTAQSAQGSTSSQAGSWTIADRYLRFTIGVTWELSRCPHQTG